MNRFFHFVVWGAVGLDSWVGPMRVRVGGKVMFGNKNITFFFGRNALQIAISMVVPPF
jgi:hypothetical protein